MSLSGQMQKDGEKEFYGIFLGSPLI